ncbi:MAG: electron transfer flavoprotein subunit alpha/FixB family protein [Luteitalea sp.]|nr:electron transfer flavoprotein subunit alpha/FixB family protein [Luteitalea sp.]
MILVIAEHGRGEVNRATWEVVAAAQQTGEPVKVVVVGHDCRGVASELATASVDEVLLVEDAALATYTADGYTAAIAAVVQAEAATLVLVAHTYQARDFVPKLAARLDRPLVADCVGLRRQDNAWRFVRPMFQAKLAADVLVDGPAPHFVSLQLGSFRADQVQRGASAVPVRPVAVSIDSAAIRQRPEEPFKEAKQAVDLTQADCIVSIGRGIKGPEHVVLAQQLADALSAELAASRPICDAGWLPMDRQIGSSGQTVAPKLYLALGISGAIQHVVGMKGSRMIVAINKDPEAPIFELADYAIAADLFDVVPAIIAELNSQS